MHVFCVYCVCRVLCKWKQPKMLRNDFRFSFSTDNARVAHTSRAYWGYTISCHHPAARTHECLTSCLAQPVSFSVGVCVCGYRLHAFSIPMARVLAPRPLFMITYFIWLLHRAQTIDLSCSENKLWRKRHGKNRTITHSNARCAHKKERYTP